MKWILISENLRKAFHSLAGFSPGPLVTPLWLQQSSGEAMSLRHLASRVLSQTSRFLKTLRNHHTVTRKLSVIGESAQSLPASQILKSSHVSSYWQWTAKARAAFIRSVQQHGSDGLVAGLKKKMLQHLMVGDTIPFMTLVGISMASAGSGGVVIGGQDEDSYNQLEEMSAVCRLIREAVYKLDWVYDKSFWEENLEALHSRGSVSTRDFIFGPYITKGSEAAVYSAAWKTPDTGKSKEDKERSVRKKRREEDDRKYPLAIKFRFNLEAESNAFAIYHAMQLEMLPALSIQGNFDTIPTFCRKKITPLPCHPNIVATTCAFADRFPNLPGNLEHYPDVLPSRIHPQGSGRNMTLFLVMKRYDMSLEKYLELHPPESMRTQVLILAQILEGVLHLNWHRVAHRDLKTNNILVGLEEGVEYPHVVITDFGCALSGNLEVQYPGPDAIAGNLALMAPEILSGISGANERYRRTMLNYSKSDMWTVGAISYEIFGVSNPFYSTLMSETYCEEELPSPPEHVPLLLREVIFSLLARNPSARLNAATAATVIQLFLWAPQSWLDPHQEDSIPKPEDITNWLLALTAKLIYEARHISSPSSGSQHPTQLEFQLISTFLSRVTPRDLDRALSFIQDAQQHQMPMLQRIVDENISPLDCGNLDSLVFALLRLQQLKLTKHDDIMLNLSGGGILCCAVRPSVHCRYQICEVAAFQQTLRKELR
ncbi:unnamed protein product [Darwinula stevensoni]|uniref:non-specific serine/threonine protein kinase n=1 Tax=Darwinula stevensoni TaxID=69355 RepID=A0A7R8X2T8_9CRUS|nr:unnamed protein product [Darwinula stevensoni]CAG0883787.1 unnamed protein product [Darwinula stevensoni]